MKHKFLLKNNNLKLILFFNGWGMDEHPVSHLTSSEFDVMMFYDYSEISKIDLREILQYKEINIIAWSMGVWAASGISELKNLKIENAIAINGTEKPVDNDFGIPLIIFEGTLNGLNEISINKFYQRMCSDKSLYVQFLNQKPDRSLISQIEELKSIGENTQNNFDSGIIWNKIFIGNRDRIIPFQNQQNFWKDHSNIVETDWPHYPFLFFSKWEEILDC